MESELRRYAFIFVSPEKLEDGSFLQKLASLNVALVVLDEAHLAHDYKHWRVSYGKWHSKLHSARVCTDDSVKLLLTGTLQIQDQDSLLQSCKLTSTNMCVIRCSADKDNVNLSVQPKSDNLKDSNLKGWVKWWCNVLHGTMIFPAMRAAVLGETEPEFQRLPTTNNQAEAINSSKKALLHTRSQLCPAILDSFLYALKQEKADVAV